MHTHGVFRPASEAEARERYEQLGPPAQTVVREVAKAMQLDADTYRDRVTPAVVETARDALFASLLTVEVGTREEYEAWRADFDGEVIEAGSPDVGNVAWHAPGFGDTAVAATFEREETAAVAALQRQAYGRLYRDLLAAEDEPEPA